jgi:hypothetical protein
MRSVMSKLFILMLLSVLAFTSFVRADDKPWRLIHAGGYAFEIYKGEQLAATVSPTHWGPEWKWYEFPKGITINPDGSQFLTSTVKVPGTDVDVTLDYKLDLAETSAKWTYEFNAGMATAVVGSVLEVKPDANFFAGGKVNFINDTGATDTRDWPLGTTDTVGPYSKAEFVAATGETFTIEFAPMAMVAGQGEGVRLFMAKDDLQVGLNGPRTFTLTGSGASAFKPKADAAPAGNSMSNDISNWFAYPVDKFGPPVDLSFLNKDEAGNYVPAGSKGFLSVNQDQFAFPDGTRARFWGLNVTAAAVTESRARNKQIAERLSKMGVNMVRIHHLDSWHKSIIDDANKDGTTQNLRKETLDTIDSFVQDLSARGIYVKPDPWVQRFFKEKDNVASWQKFSQRLNHHLHPYVFFDPRMQELIFKQVDGVLEYQGPFSKKSMYDNPAIALFQPANEAFMMRGSGQVEHEPYASNFRKLFEEWQRSKGLAVGGDPIGVNYLPDHQKFYVDLMRKFYGDFAKKYRQDGMKIPIGSSNWMNWTWEFRSQLAGDFMDAHHYYGGDRIGPGGELGRLWTLDAPGRTYGPFGPIAASRATGKPFIVSETGDNPPKTFRAAFPIGLAAVASLQDWDGIIGYAYSQYPHPRGQLDPFEWESDPVLTATWMAGALIYRRQDVRPAGEVFTMHLTGEEQYALHWEAENKKMYFNSPQFNQLLETSRVNVWTEDDGPIPAGGGTVLTADQSRSFMPKNPIISDTGELTRDFQQGWGSTSTDRTAAAYGMIGGQTINTSGATFNIQTPFAVAVLSSLTDSAIGESDRMLLVTAARAQNTGRVVDLATRQVTSEGKGPVICEPVVGSISIRTNRPSLSLVAINADGTKQAARRFESVNGVVTLQLEASAKTLFYEVVAE